MPCQPNKCFKQTITLASLIDWNAYFDQFDLFDIYNHLLTILKRVCFSKPVTFLLHSASYWPLSLLVQTIRIRFEGLTCFYLTAKGFCFYLVKISHHRRQI